MTVYTRALDFLTYVAEPDHQDSWMNPMSLRHAYHLCVSLFSLRDWVFAEFSSQPGWRWGQDIRTFQSYLESECAEFAIVSDIANSAKHLRLDRNRSGVSGADHVALFGSLAVGGHPVGGAPTLEVVGGSTIYPLIQTATKVLTMWQRLFVENNWD